MNRTDMKLNKMLMKDMGLVEDDNHRIIDMDDGEICCFGTREIVSPGYFGERGIVQFDAINNPKMMNTLFMQFVDKLAEEESIDGCTSFGTYVVPGSKKIVARMTMDSGEIIESKPYKTEGLCYVELVKRLNGDDDHDMTRYDSINRRKSAQVKPGKRF